MISSEALNRFQRNLIQIFNEQSEDPQPAERQSSVLRCVASEESTPPRVRAVKNVFGVQSFSLVEFQDSDCTNMLRSRRVEEVHDEYRHRCHRGCSCAPQNIF